MTFKEWLRAVTKPENEELRLLARTAAENCTLLPLIESAENTDEILIALHAAERMRIAVSTTPKTPGPR